MAATQQPDLQPDQILQNRYHIMGRLDSGGFGVIYHAKDSSVGIEVAIKENKDSSTDAQRRFKREAHMLAKLKHSNLPSVKHHFIEQDDPALIGRQYLVMEFIPGEDLQEIIESKGAQDEKTVIGWMNQVMDALTYMHNQTAPDTGRIVPMIHHDVKPSNIKLTPDGKVFLVDFGLAKQSIPEYSTRSSLPLSSGTHGYAPPEQYDEKRRTDERSDIYALGATFYHLLTARKPLEATNLREGHQMAPVREVKSNISKQTLSVIQKAMALEPDKRYPNVRAMQDALNSEIRTWRQYVVQIVSTLVLVATLINGYVDGFEQISRAWNYVTSQLFPETTYVNPIDGATYLHIPAGEFIMGSTDEEVDYALELCTKYYGDCERSWFTGQQPQHRVYLDSYWIMETEVTNAQYRKFMEADGYTTESYWSEEGWSWRDTATQPGCWYNGLYNGEQQPVVCVTWYEAEAYTNWLSAETGLDFRLPTEAEWEKAARGTDGRHFPWGDRWDGSRVNYCDKNCTKDWADESVDDGYQYAAPVRSYPRGVSPYGILDIAGNVDEWVSDWYDHEYYKNSPKQNPIGPDDRDGRVRRGGYWGEAPFNMLIAVRTYLTPSSAGTNIGFRVVLSSPDF